MEKIRKNYLPIVLAVLLALAIVLNIRQSNALADAKTRISAVYQKAFYETVQLTGAVASNYKKLTVAGDNARIQPLLGEISRETQGASANLALLPLGEETVSATIKFINQAEDFAESLSERIASGGNITLQDYETISLLSSEAEKFHAAMLDLLARYESGEAVFDAADFTVNGDEGLYPITNAEGAYPKLLYDGPFSDAESTGEFEYLASLPEVTKEQAQNRLAAFLPLENIVFTGESNPEIPCYEFSASTGGTPVSAAVTKNGGMILYILPEHAAGETRMDAGKLAAGAAEFLKEKGFGDMHMSYFSAFGGILTVNFAPIQEGVIIYPELIKLQISMQDGSIIGMDAEAYLRNHKQRVFPEAIMDAEQAQAGISPRLNALGAQKCVIPKDGREYFTWEIRATDGETAYLVYIDAENGIERDLMQVITAVQGTLVM